MTPSDPSVPDSGMGELMERMRAYLAATPSGDGRTFHSGHPEVLISEALALLARVEAATGPDREIDYGINKLFTGRRWRFTPAEVCAYTSSLDAIVRLIERELPSSRWQIHPGSMSPARPIAWHGSVSSSAPIVVIYGGDGATPVLAIAAAFLRALSSSTEKTSD